MNKKIPALDGVRALALLNVLILHAVSIFFPKATPYISGMAQFGVWLFFILSAFLLTNRFFVTGFTYSGVISYLLGRTLRIIPVFVLAVFAYSYGGLFSKDRILLILTFKQTYLHLWTIPVEYTFYFILPLFAYVSIKLTEKYSAWHAVFILALIIIIHQMLYPYTDFSNSGTMKWYIPVFLYGVMASCVFNRSSLKIGSKSADAIAILIIFSCVAISPMIIKSLNIAITGGTSNKFVFYGPLFAILVYAACTSKGYFSKAMESKIMMLIGKWSFSIYLWHLLVMFKMSNGSKENMTIFALSIVASIGVGIISFNVIEEPCERFRHRIMAKINKIGVKKLASKNMLC